MADYLVFRLYGPLASWGEIAVGESRHSAVNPSRSALLGLLGAALGIERTDDDGQAALTAGYQFGVKLVSAGSPMRDYHTVQAPPQQAKVQYRTRRQELIDESRVGTLLSSREYRCDSIAVVAVLAREGAPRTLDELADALRRPVFPLYLGRKSCPLALPLGPQLVQAETLRLALDSAAQCSLTDLPKKPTPGAWPSPSDKWAFRPGQARYYWETGMDAGMPVSFQADRNDEPLSRRRWQFVPRRESVHLAGEDGQ